MKPLITICLAFIVSATAMGQSKRSKHSDTSTKRIYVYGDSIRGSTINHLGYRSLRFSDAASFKPVRWYFLSGGSTYIIMFGAKNGRPDMDNWDTMHFSMKKENFRWLNDSTAVYIKPTK